jgi:small subunit ribosomal protein S3Ae
MPRRRRRIKDKWKLKTWITVYSPPYLGNRPIAHIPVTNPENAIGRVVETTLYDLTGEVQLITTKLFFQIYSIENSVAKTILKGHEYAREYLKSLIRRGSSLVDFIKDYTTIDGIKVRVYTIAFTQRRINSSRKHAIRLAADKVISERASKLNYEQFMQEVIFGKLGADILAEAKKVARLRHLGVRKTKLAVKLEDYIKIKEEVKKEALASS